MSEELRIAPEGAKRTTDSIVKELVEICDELEYDIGKLPYKFMIEEPAARSLFNNYEKLQRFLQTYRSNLI